MRSAWHMQCSWSLVAIILIRSWCGGNMFLENPATQTVVPGAVAQFICVFVCTNNYYFELNGNHDFEDDQYPIYYSDCNTTSRILIISLVAGNSLNPNGSTIQCFFDADEGGYDPSDIAYMFVAGPPLAPSPRVWSLNTTALVISWEKPFASVQVANIYSYTIKMFNSSNNEMRTWIADVGAGVACYCTRTDSSSTYADPCLDKATVDKLNQSYNNFVVTRTNAAERCDTLVFHVSAVNVVGESEAAAMRGGFLTEWKFQPASEADAYFDLNKGIMVVLLNIQLPELCYITAMYKLSIQNLPTSFMFESSADTTQILIDIPLEYLPTKGNTNVITILLQFLDWSTLYSFNFSTGQLVETGYSWTAINTDHCNAQYAALGVMSGAVCLLLVIIMGMLLHHRVKMGAQRQVMSIQHNNPIYTENEHHQYETLEKYKQLFINLRDNSQQIESQQTLVP